MIHRGIKFAYALIMVAAAAFAFIVMRNFDEAAVAGPSYVVLISQSDGRVSADDVKEMVVDFARTRSINIGRLTSDARAPETHRHVYLAVGDQDAESTAWLKSGYPNFSRNAKTYMHPYEELDGVGPIGYYFVYGPEDAARALYSHFEELGLSGRIDPLFSISRALEYFGRGALLWCFLVVVLVSVVTVAAAVVLNAKAYGVQRLQGSAFAVVLGRDMAQIVRFCCGALVAVSVFALAFLHLYNGLSRLLTYGLVAAAFFAVFVAVTLMAHIVALALVYLSGILGALKGQVSGGWALFLAYLLRFAAVLLALSIGTSLVSSLIEYQDSREDIGAWAERGPTYFMKLGGFSMSESRQVATEIGGWIREADNRGEVLLSKVALLDGPRGGGPSSPELRVLLVNERYLADNEVYDPSGNLVKPASDADGRARVLIPSGKLDDSEMIVQRVRAEVLTTSTTPADVEIPVRVEPIRDNQKFFSYASWLADHDLVLTDPIVVVVTGRSNLIPDGNYMAFASTGDVVFSDPDAATESLKAANLSRYVQGFRLKSQEAAEHHRLVSRELNMQLLNLAAAVAVLFMTGLSVSIVYSRRNAQTLFVKFIGGWRFASTFRSVLIAELALGVSLVAYTVWRVNGEIAARTGPWAPPARQTDLLVLSLEPFAAAAVAVTGLGLVVASLVWTYNKVVKEHSANLA